VNLRENDSQRLVELLARHPTLAPGVDLGNTWFAMQYDQYFNHDNWPLVAPDPPALDPLEVDLVREAHDGDDFLLGVLNAQQGPAHLAVLAIDGVPTPCFEVHEVEESLEGAILARSAPDRVVLAYKTSEDFQLGIKWARENASVEMMAQWARQLARDWAGGESPWSSLEPTIFADPSATRPSTVTVQLTSDEMLQAVEIAQRRSAYKRADSPN
jgi:hypothetical protein